MREFEVTVTRVDTYKIKIDEDLIDKNLIQEYEESFHKLGKYEQDKIKSLAHQIGFLAMDNGNDFYEGVGYVKTDNLGLSTIDYEKGISIETIELEDFEVECEEI